MKGARDKILAVARLLVGIAIVTGLLYSINRGTLLVELDVAPCTVPRGAMYVLEEDSPNRFIVLDDVDNSSPVRTVYPAKAADDLPQSGVLIRCGDQGPATIAWTGMRTSAYGLQMLGRSFTAAGRNWPFLAAGVAGFFLCLAFCIVRWKLILDAQGLKVPWKEVWRISFIGHFFNSFMLGAVGGDLVKAYYVARLTGHLKTEAVSTVFIDRVVGLIALIFLAATTMLLRLEFFMARTETRIALFFLFALAGACLLGFTVLFALKKIPVREGGSVQRLMDTGPGRIINRAYRTLQLCLTHPTLLAKTLVLSLLNHVTLIAVMYWLGRAVMIDLSFWYYLALGPTINAVASIPLTPGGLGLREYGAVLYLGIVGVSPTQAMPLSLLLYAAVLFWSLVGGVVFLLSSSGGKTGTIIIDARDQANESVPDTV